MSSPADGPLSGWSLSWGQAPAAREGARLLAALGVRSTAVAKQRFALRTPDGPVADLPGLGVLGPDPERDWLASGAVSLTGMRAGSPVLPAGAAASRIGGALLAVRALSRLGGREVDLDGRTLLGERAALAGLTRRGPASPGGGTRIVPTGDGAVAFTLARASDREALAALFERGNVGEPWSALRRWAASRTVAAVVERAVLLGLAVGAVPSAATPALPPYHLRPLGDGHGPGRPVPLVVDLTSLWAGPLAANLLGHAGCRVVKVESAGRLDGARRGPSAFYDLLHHGHESITVDLRDEAGLRVLRRLVAAADLVLEAARPRALSQLGLDPGDSGGSWVAIRAYDPLGPSADRAGFGDDVAAAAGAVVLASNGRVLPVGDALADPIAGALAAVAALAVLAGGRRWYVQTSLEQAVRGCVRPSPGRPCERAGRGWTAWTAGGPVRVARPEARAVPGPAATAGADNARLDELLTC